LIRCVTTDKIKCQNIVHFYNVRKA
jgi:hypothetical protein